MGESRPAGWMCMGRGGRSWAEDQCYGSPAVLLLLLLLPSAAWAACILMGVCGPPQAC